MFPTRTVDLSPQLSNTRPRHPWYALRVKQRYATAAASSLRNQGYDEFLPLYTSVRRWSDRICKLDLPLFPGYLFCRFDYSDRRSVLMTPGVMSIVEFCKQPHPVDESEIAALETVAQSGLLMQPWPFLKVGERVTIQDGPLRNVEASVARLGDGCKLILSVTLLQRSVAVSVDRSWIRPIAA